MRITACASPDDSWIAAAIEQRILAVPGIAQCVVREFDDPRGRTTAMRLLVAEPNATVRIDALRASLAESLAPPLMPAAFVLLDSFPLTRDMKVDAARLPNPGRARPPLGYDYVAPRTDFERWLAGVWSEVLGNRSGRHR